MRTFILSAIFAALGFSQCTVGYDPLLRKLTCPPPGPGSMGSGIISLNGLNGATQTFTNDTNVTVSSSGTAHAFGWTGTLAAARLNANVVQSIVNDTNITGTISAQALTIGWTGTLAGARGGTGNGFFAISGPASSLKTWTIPNQSINWTALTGIAKLTAGVPSAAVAGTDYQIPFMGRCTLSAGTGAVTATDTGTCTVFQQTLTGNVTITLSGFVDGKTYQFQLTQDGTGGRVPTASAIVALPLSITSSGTMNQFYCTYDANAGTCNVVGANNNGGLSPAPYGLALPATPSAGVVSTLEPTQKRYMQINDAGNTYGTVQDIAAIANRYVSSIVSGVPVIAARPACATLSDAGTGCNGTVASANTASAIVARDGSGNFSAGTITASLTGNASGTAATITGLVAKANTPFTTKGDLWVTDGTNMHRLGVGSDTQILTADSTQTDGVKWATGSAGSGYTTIKDETTPLTQRSTLAFLGSGVTCVDNNSQTECTIAGGAAPVSSVAVDGTADTTGTVQLGGEVTYTGNQTQAQSDCGKTIKMNGSSITLTLAATPIAKCRFKVLNIHSTALTIGRNSLTINGGTSNPSLNQYQWADISTDGTNYFAAFPVSAGTGLAYTATAAGPTLGIDSTVATKAGNNVFTTGPDDFSAVVLKNGPSAPVTQSNDFLCDNNTTMAGYVCASSIGTTETYFTNVIATISNAGGAAATVNTIDGTHAGIWFKTIFDVVGDNSPSFVWKLVACSSLSGQTCNNRTVLWQNTGVAINTSSNAQSSLIDCMVLGTPTTATVNTVSCTFRSVNSATAGTNSAWVTGIPNTGASWVLVWSIQYGTATHTDMVAQLGTGKMWVY